MRLPFFAALTGTLLTAGIATAADDKAEILIINQRPQPITMQFDYAFRDRHWHLIDHVVESNDEITYRFPSNIPGCEYLRDWHITDGILSITDTKGLFCEKRISLCDKSAAVMTVQTAQCLWQDR